MPTKLSLGPSTDNQAHISFLTWHTMFWEHCMHVYSLAFWEDSITKMWKKSEEFRKGCFIIITFTHKSLKNYRFFLLTWKVLSHFLLYGLSLPFLGSSRVSTALVQAGLCLLFPDRVIMLYRIAFLLAWTSAFLLFHQTQKLQTFLGTEVQIQASWSGSASGVLSKCMS